LDLRVERLERDEVADHRDLDVDQEQELRPPPRQRCGIADDIGEVELHDLAEPAGQDRDHERAEEALDRPGAQVVSDLRGVVSLAPDQHRAEVPGAVARVDQNPVDPQHVRD